MRVWIPLLALSALMLDLGIAHAQLFGRPRVFGQPIARRSEIPTLEEVGQISGTERFLRGNRDRSSFVGADRVEAQQGFIGSQQGRTTGVIVSSTAGIEPPPDRSRQINRPLQRPGSDSMYLPRIRLALRTPAPAGTRDVVTRVTAAAQLASRWPISVLVEGRTAILQGEVASVSEADLAETLVLFEPGISRVENLLRLRRPVSAPDPLP